MKKQKNYFTRVSAQVLLLAMSLSLLDSCTQGFRTEQETPAVSGITLLLPKENQEFGELLSKTLRETTIAVKEKHIALSDQKAVYAAAAQAAQSVLKEEGKEPVLLTTGETYEMVAEGAASDKALTAKPELTATQKAYLDRIEVAIMQSPTYARFAEALVKINNEIAEAVPAEERALLLNVTATLHYGLKTMNELVGEGLLPGQAEKSGVQDIQVGALSQAGFFPLLLVAGGGEKGNPVAAECKGWWSCWGRCTLGVVGVVGASVGAIWVTGGGALIAFAVTKTLTIASAMDACGAFDKTIETEYQRKSDPKLDEILEFIPYER